MRRPVVYLIFLALVVNCLGQIIIPPEKQAAIDQLIDTLMTNNHIPGLGLSIIKGDEEILYRRGYGMANVEASLPAHQGTLFAIGSITKSFTAAIVVKTLNEMFPQYSSGVLTIPIRELAPTYNFTLLDRYRSERTTFTDLLAHRVCVLPDGLGTWSQATTDPKEEAFRQRYAPEICGFRNSYVYNNGLIAMAADIIAHMANSTYDDMLQQFLNDLGMTSTTWVKWSDDHNNMFGRSVPYIWKDGELQRFNAEILKSVVALGPAGDILSSASDMAKYMEFHLNRGKVGENQIIPADVIQWMYQSWNPLGSGIVKTEDDPNVTLDVVLGYGLCLEVGLYDGWIRVAHGGYLPPYESYMSLYHDMKLGIFTSSNGPGTLYFTGNLRMDGVHSAIVAILQGNTTTLAHTRGSGSTYGPFPPSKPSTIVNWNQKYVDSNPEIRIDPEEILGSFGNGLNGEFNITLRNNSQGQMQPYLEYGALNRGWLNQFSNSSFLLDYDTDLWMMKWTFGLGMPNVTLHFVDVDTIKFIEDGSQDSDDFLRGIDIHDLPEIPWSPGSC